MTALPPDPDPSRTPGLEPGSGVPPGSTPPDSAQTSGLSEQQPRPKRRMTPLAVISLIAVGVFVLLFVVVAVALVFTVP
ncbi:DUF6480 family protein [Mycobacterium angelicum]|uniref:Uncharacterized protein n=1 Tax=Mycobacterium angelicum TaxID=470074 RepID=A0A1W9ZNW0_MYCAN|nr:DUF6480 family protein [Mycobacterium angelicum]MCV7199503.1 hypothetical protein [Mycobacterium angelicum]ORA19313.1 hypothetical protein BST12_17580 [Mycobacterium angelicum]